MTGSVAVRADSRHYGEVPVNLRIIAALCLDTLIGWPAADPDPRHGDRGYLVYNGGRVGLDS